MEILAKKFLISLSELQNKADQISNNIRQDHLDTIKSVLDNNLPLKEIKVQEVFFAIIHNFLLYQNQVIKIDEYLLIKLLHLLFILFNKSKQGIYSLQFINTSKEFRDCTALLITTLIQNLDHQSKQVIKEILSIFEMIWLLIDAEHKQMIYPKFCSNMFKFINNEYESSRKFSSVKIKVLNIIEVSLNSILEKYNGFENQQQQQQQNLNNTLNKEDKHLMQLKNFLIGVQKCSFKSSNIANLCTVQSQESQKTFEQIVIHHVEQFLQTLSKNAEQNGKESNKKLQLKFCQFSFNIFSQSVKSWNLSIQCMMSILQIYFYFSKSLSKEEDNYLNQIIDVITTRNSNSDYLVTLFEAIKRHMLEEFIRLPQLVNEIDDEIYIKSIRTISKSFNLINSIMEICREATFLNEEKETIKEKINKSFHFNFNMKIKLTNPCQIIPLQDFDPHALSSMTLINNLKANYSRNKNSLLIQSLLILNYKEELIEEIQNLIFSLNEEMAISLFDYFYERLIEINLAEKLAQNSLTSNLIAIICQTNYILICLIQRWLHTSNINIIINEISKKEKFLQTENQTLCVSQVQNQLIKNKVTNFYEHQLFTDFYENISINHEDVELMQLLQMEACFTSYIFIQFSNQQISNQKIELHKYTLDMQIITYLLKKHSINNYSIRQFCDLCFNQLILIINNNKSFSDILKKYSTTIVQRCITQIKSLQMIGDKEGPFNILNELFVTFQGFSYLENEVKTVISALNRCYDNFYLRSDKVFIVLYLNFFRSFIKFWEANVVKKNAENLMRNQKRKTEKSQIKQQQHTNCEEQQHNEFQGQGTQELQQNSDDEDDEKDTENHLNKLNITNIVRQLLLRIKPQILNQDKMISVTTLQIFNHSIKVMFGKKMVVETEKINFSTNDANNVSIPDALGPLSYEFLDTFLYILKDSGTRQGQFTSSALQVTQILINLYELGDHYAFFFTKAVQVNLLPLFTNNIKEYSFDLKNTIRSKIVRNILIFIKNFQAKNKFQQNNIINEKSQECLIQLKQRITQFIADSENKSVSLVYINAAKDVLEILNLIEYNNNK